MTTNIYADYAAFAAREDKESNGVSEAFSKEHPGFVLENEKNKACWNCRDCSDCSDCRGCRYCSYCSDCSGCRDCSDCSDCRGCSGCSDCSDCTKKEGVKTPPESSWFSVPIIENIHTRMLEAVSKPDALDMGNWHTCDTTHCRAGWVVTLAGEKGKALEAASSTLFAAMQIYKASSPVRVSPVRFFEKNAVAMADMQRCAEVEASAKQ